jgi:hypothetical protein
MTNHNIKLTEAALSNLSPLDEGKQADDLARWSDKNYPALAREFERVEGAVQLAQKNQKKMMSRMPGQANPRGETKTILDALVKFQKTLDAAIKLAQKQSK